MEQVLTLVSIMALAGAAAGFMAGLLGVGGGVVMVPALFFALGTTGMDPAWQMHMAVATSLAVIIPTAISSARSHHKRGAVDFMIVSRWGPAVLVGAFAGAILAGRLSTAALVLFFAVMAFLIGVKLLLPYKEKAIARTIPGYVGSSLIGGFIGVASALMGIGGGAFSVATMTVFGVPIHRAIGTSSLLGLLIAVPATLGFLIDGAGVPGRPDFSVGFVNFAAAAIIAPVSALVAPLGVRAAHALPRRALSVFFGLFLIATAIRLAFEV